MSARKTKAKPAPRLEPPFELTDAEVSEVLATHRLKAGSLAAETERSTSLLHELADELESIAEGVMSAINDRDHGDRQSSRWMADSLLSFSRSLGDVAARMARYSGRLEAYRDAEDRATRAEDMVEAHRDGTLGRPKPDIEIGRAGRRLREAEVTP